MKRVFLAIAVVLALAAPAQAQYVLRTTVTVTAPSTPATANGTPAIQPLDVYHSAEIVGALTGNTGGPLNVYLQTSFDGGTTWCDYAAFAQVAAAAPLARFRFTTSKSTPPNATISPCTDGTLAAGTVLGGDWGDRFRVKAISGALTTVGVAQSVFVTFSP